MYLSPSSPALQALELGRQLSLRLQSSLLPSGLLYIPVLSYMNTTTQQLIAFGRHVRDDLLAIKNALIGIRDNLQKQTEAEHEARNADDQSHNAPQVLRAELQVPHTIEVETHPKDKKTGREWYKLVVETITLLGVLAYAAIAAFQWCEMKKATVATQQAADAATSAATTAAVALKTSQQQFRTEQRPYIWADPRGAFQRPEGGYADWEIRNGRFYFDVVVDLRNGGRSPAIDVIITDSVYKIGPLDKVRQEVRSYVPKYGDTPGIMVAETTFAPISAMRELSKDEQNHIIDGTFEAYVVGAVKYRDAFPPRIKPYETTYCFQIHARGLPFADCHLGKDAFGNWMK